MITMEATIDRAGRLVVPKALRAALGLANGGRVVIFPEDGRLVIEPAPVTKTLERRGRGLVCVASEPLPSMSAEDVRAILEATRP